MSPDSILCQPLLVPQYGVTRRIKLHEEFGLRRIYNTLRLPGSGAYADIIQDQIRALGFKGIKNFLGSADIGAHLNINRHLAGIAIILVFRKKPRVPLSFSISSCWVRLGAVAPIRA